MRITPDESLFIAIDYQEKLLPAIHDNEKLLKKSIFLIDGLKELDIPMFMTTQYKKGLGENVSAIADRIDPEHETDFDKITFSIWQDDKIREYIEKSGKKFILVGGTETHICVLQSLIDMKAAGFTPVLITDCVSSRFPEDKKMAIVRAAQEGVLITTAESLLYELMLSAKHKHFKKITALVKEQ